MRAKARRVIGGHVGSRWGCDLVDEVVLPFQLPKDRLGFVGSHLRSAAFVSTVHVQAQEE